MSELELIALPKATANEIFGGWPSCFPCGQKGKRCFWPYVISSGSFVLQNEQRLQLQACNKFAANRGAVCGFLCCDYVSTLKESPLAHTWLQRNTFSSSTQVYLREVQSGNCTVELDHHPCFWSQPLGSVVCVQKCAGIWCCNRNDSELIWIPDEGTFMELAACSDTVWVPLTAPTW